MVVMLLISAQPHDLQPLGAGVAVGGLLPGGWTWELGLERLALGTQENPNSPCPPGAFRGRSGKQPTCVGLGPVPQASTPWATLSCRCFQKGAGSEGPQLPGRWKGVCSKVRWATTQTRLADAGESRTRVLCAEDQTWHIGVQLPSSRLLRIWSVSRILKY